MAIHCRAAKNSLRGTIIILHNNSTFKRSLHSCMKLFSFSNFENIPSQPLFSFFALSILYLGFLSIFKNNSRSRFQDEHSTVLIKGQLI
jgi:hypothetical protein